MAQNITLQGATYSAVPAVDLPKQGGGTARFTDTSPTTATASDVASGKIFFASNGTQTTGTASGGGGSEYVVTLSYNSVSQKWEPDQSFSDIKTAYDAGKTVTVSLDWFNTGATADGYFFVDDGIEYLLYMVNQPNDGGTLDYTVYVYDSNGVDVDETGTYYMPTGTKTITGSGTTDVAAYANAYVAAGTAGTPTATKGTVNNHAISVTPSVTNTTGYITGGTKTGTAVSVAASELVSGSETKTANGTYDVTNLAQIVVNVSGGGGGLTLLYTKSLGALSTTSTSSANTGQSLSVTGYNAYDLLIVDVSVDTQVNGRHTSTVSLIILTGTSNVNTKNNYALVSNKWNSKLSSSGTPSTRNNTTVYGVYANSATVSGTTMTIPIYYKYSNSYTGTIDGTYTARVYGVKLYDLIGG